MFFLIYAGIGYEIFSLLFLWLHSEDLPKAATNITVNGRDSMAAVIHFYLTSAEALTCTVVPDFVLTLDCGQLVSPM